MREEFDTTSAESLICPYCGAEQEDAREQEDWAEPETWTCCDCDRDFIYTTETYIKFTSEDLGEHFSDKLQQENLWLTTLKKNLEAANLKAGQDLPADVDRIKRNIERSEEKIAKYQEKLKDYKLQTPCYVSNCCGTSIIENTDLCSKCGEHCEVEQCS